MDYDVDVGVFEESICLQSAALGKVAFMVIEVKEDITSVGGEKKQTLFIKNIFIYLKVWG